MGKSAANSSSQRALVVGVSDYPNPADRLPGVAADVKEMAKLLGSKHGGFQTGGVSVLTDKQATRQRILADLEKTFVGAAADETVFVYLAGHGTVEGSDYYFVAHDTDVVNLGTTGVPLTSIKILFDRTASRRAFLWLDFCHSGGILARKPRADELSTIRRSLEVVKGEGKVIVAACTSSQLAYESPTVGHGLFTHALLRGLKGEAKSAEGEVTALSLYDFIDRQVATGKQQPVFLGQMKGRIVLMHYPDRSGGSDTKTPITKKNTKASAKKSGTWIMLGDKYFLAEKVQHQSDGKVEVDVSPLDGEQEAALAALRPNNYGGRTSLPFAVNNDAHVVRVEHVRSTTVSGKQVWTLSLSVEANSNGGAMSEFSYNGIGPDEIARRRAGRLLLNDPPARAGTRRGFDSDSMLNGIIESTSSRYPIRDCVVRSVYHQHGQSPDWKEFARLSAIFYLKVTNTVEHVLDLTLGAVRNGCVAVTFRGRRPQRYANVTPETIEISGQCPLSS